MSEERRKEIEAAIKMVNQIYSGDMEGKSFVFVPQRMNTGADIKAGNPLFNYRERYFPFIDEMDYCPLMEFSDGYVPRKYELFFRTCRATTKKVVHVTSQYGNSYSLKESDTPGKYIADPLAISYDNRGYAHTGEELTSRLVAERYCINRTGKTFSDCQVHHYDGNQKNNAFYNLVIVDKNTSPDPEERDIHNTLDKLAGFEMCFEDEGWLPVVPEDIFELLHCEWKDIIDPTKEAIEKAPDGESSVIVKVTGISVRAVLKKK